MSSSFWRSQRFAPETFVWEGEDSIPTCGEVIRAKRKEQVQLNELDPKSANERLKPQQIKSGKAQVNEGFKLQRLKRRRPAVLSGRLAFFFLLSQKLLQP